MLPESMVQMHVLDFLDVSFNAIGEVSPDLITLACLQVRSRAFSKLSFLNLVKHKMCQKNEAWLEHSAALLKLPAQNSNSHQIGYATKPS